MDPQELFHERARQFTGHGVPDGDTTGLAEIPGTAVWLVRGATHCVPERFRLLIPAVQAWLAARLAPGPGTRAAEAARLDPLAPHLQRGTAGERDAGERDAGERDAGERDGAPRTPGTPPSHAADAQTFTPKSDAMPDRPEA
ncbi:hypothetical protein [Actinomadura madurae]|uniref:hypothetical protein n=1 Tax=Actinomadura madurae TaxID=1993 RepID=UPI000DD08A11|nr:hypothetical protein [Actinomadura madurae]